MIFELDYPYAKAPLSMNGREHWRVKAAATHAIRDLTRILGRDIPNMGRCLVELTWYVTDARRRDVDNLMPTYKAMCDELVSLGVAPDDTPHYMTKRMPIIEQIPKRDGPAHMILRVWAYGRGDTV